MTFEIIPSIDLKGGRCVRLYQGDYSKETVFSDDPAAIARKWESEGAPRLHVIDLDGASAGEPRHLPLIMTIASQLSIPVQAGGGIRSMRTIRDLLAAGVQRVILGTAAVEEPGLVKEASGQYGERIIVGIDARAGQAQGGDTPVSGHVAVHGWRRDAPKLALELARDMMELGVRRFIYTDIVRDGTLTQPNFAAIAEMVSQATGTSIIASGGVTKLEHLVRLREIGAGGAVIGRALYTGDINLEQAIRALRRDSTQC